MAGGGLLQDSHQRITPVTADEIFFLQILGLVATPPKKTSKKDGELSHIHLFMSYFSRI